MCRVPIVKNWCILGNCNSSKISTTFWILRIHQLKTGQLQDPFSPNIEMCFIPDFYSCSSVARTHTSSAAWPSVVAPWWLTLMAVTRLRRGGSISFTDRLTFCSGRLTRGSGNCLAWVWSHPTRRTFWSAGQTSAMNALLSGVAICYLCCCKFVLSSLGTTTLS